jgi:hypothetical protein
MSTSGLKWMDGIRSFTALLVSRTFKMMKNGEVVKEMIHFLHEERFANPQAQALINRQPNSG